MHLQSTSTQMVTLSVNASGDVVLVDIIQGVNASTTNTLSSSLKQWLQI